MVESSAPSSFPLRLFHPGKQAEQSKNPTRIKVGRAQSIPYLAIDIPHAHVSWETELKRLLREKAFGSEFVIQNYHNGDYSKLHIAFPADHPRLREAALVVDNYLQT